MSTLIACDLDQTLIYSARSAGTSVDDAVVVEMLDGRPQSYVTAPAGAAIEALTISGEFVAVTSRTRAQLARVTLPGPPPRWAIAANGGLILDDGIPDAAWTRRVTRDLAGGTALAEVEQHVTRICRPEWTTVQRTAEDLFVYAVVDPACRPDDLIDTETAWAAAHGWVFSAQGRKLYWIPQAVSKAAAVRELAGRLGAETVLAAGDSRLDRDLLDSADAAWLPRHGELAADGYGAPGDRADHVRITAASGIAAGEEIALALTACAAAREGVTVR